jgi:hypothetical protein
MSILLKILYAAVACLLTAQATLVDEAVHNVQKRTAYYGGFALAISQNDCPSGTFSCSGALNVSGAVVGGPCCPLHTSCSQIGTECCPDANADAACRATIGANPTCADPSWVMFTEGSLAEKNLLAVCCQVGQIVDLKYQCVSPGGSGVSAQSFSFTSVSFRASESGSGREDMQLDLDMAHVCYRQLRPMMQSRRWELLLTLVVRALCLQLLHLQPRLLYLRRPTLPRRLAVQLLRVKVLKQALSQQQRPLARILARIKELYLLDFRRHT